MADVKAEAAALIKKHYGHTKMPEDFYQFWDFILHVSAILSEKERRNRANDENNSRKSKNIASRPTGATNKSGEKGTEAESDRNQAKHGPHTTYLHTLESTLGLRLVGPFEVLDYLQTTHLPGGESGGVEKKKVHAKEDIFRHSDSQRSPHLQWRYMYDPPEMMTVLAAVPPSTVISHTTDSGTSNNNGNNKDIDTDNNNDTANANANANANSNDNRHDNGNIDGDDNDNADNSKNEQSHLIDSGSSLAANAREGLHFGYFRDRVLSLPSFLAASRPDSSDSSLRCLLEPRGDHLFACLYLHLQQIMRTLEEEEEEAGMGAERKTTRKNLRNGEDGDDDGETIQPRRKRQRTNTMNRTPKLKSKSKSKSKSTSTSTLFPQVYTFPCAMPPALALADNPRKVRHWEQLSLIGTELFRFVKQLESDTVTSSRPLSNSTHNPESQSQSQSRSKSKSKSKAKGKSESKSKASTSPTSPSSLSVTISSLCVPPLKARGWVEREKKVNGSTFNGVGIVVPVKNDVGYRELPCTDAQLRRIVEGMELQSRGGGKVDWDKLDEILNLVSYANDERDPGMGLQLGVDLFCVAPSLFSGEASRVLCMAYRLLRLPLYAKIAGMHLQKGGQGGQGGGKEKDSHRRSSRGILRANNAL